MIPPLIREKLRIQIGTTAPTADEPYSDPDLETKTAYSLSTADAYM